MAKTKKTNSPKIGDNVVLNSGGPLMIVQDIELDDKDSLYCIWFDEDGHIKQFTISSKCVTIVTRPVSN